MQLISSHLIQISTPFPLLIKLHPSSFLFHTLSLSLSHSKFPPILHPLLLIKPKPPLFIYSIFSLCLSSSGDLFFLQMGICFSSTQTEPFSYAALNTALVISVNGDLHQYPLPINASQVLGLETTSPSSFFLCNSDNLYFDEYIPQLDSRQQLEVGQIYFLLPISRLQSPLTAREMAAMAVRASMALVDVSKKKKKNGQGRRIKRMQISPMSDLGENVLENEDEGKMKRFEKMESNFVGMAAVRSKSMKRAMSRKAKLGQRTFKATLSTIHEGFNAE